MAEYEIDNVNSVTSGLQRLNYFRAKARAQRKKTQAA
jgi:hypothetical protein